MRKAVLGVVLALLGAAPAVPPASADGPGLAITIIYDNYPADPACGADWGFSCLVEGLGKTVLFDTGTREDIFLKNVAALKLDLGRVDLAVLSHFHGDHFGGFDAVLRQRPGLTFYVPDDKSEPAARLSKRWANAGAKLVPVSGPLHPGNRLILPGTMGEAIREQLLVVNTSRGLVIIAGCAHPGIVGMVEKAKELTGRPIEAVIGGFHLLQTGEPDLARILSRFKELGVASVGATHCTGDKAIALFRGAYKDKFIELGAGRIVRFDM